MNQDIKGRWIAALRSGKYKQHPGVLRSGENEFCCLGVLCDVVDPDGWGIAHSAYSGTPYLDRQGAVRTVLPLSFQEDMDLDDNASFDIHSLPQKLQTRIDGLCDKPGRVTSLSDLNDRGADFELIADVIEADPAWAGYNDEDERGEEE